MRYRLQTILLDKIHSAGEFSLMKIFSGQGYLSERVSGQTFLLANSTTCTPGANDACPMAQEMHAREPTEENLPVCKDMVLLRQKQYC